jgi:TatA/E family protein of Tat protein translocase
MPGLGVGHWWIIAIVLVIVLIIWGPGKLPDVGSGLGRAIREFRKASSETRDEFVKATRADDTPAPPAPGTGPVAKPATTPDASTATPPGPLPQPAQVGGGTPDPLPAQRPGSEGDHTTAV